MAGRIPELKDLFEALNESEDEASARNAFVEYGKRGGLHTDGAAEMLRKRLAQLAMKDMKRTMEHYGKDGLTEIPVPPGTTGVKLVPADTEGGDGSPPTEPTREKASQPDKAPPSAANSEYLPMNNIQGEELLNSLAAILRLLLEMHERLGKIHGILVAINRGEKKAVPP